MSGKTEREICDLFLRCRDPARQIDIIQELTGAPVGHILKTLRRAGASPAGVNTANYRKKLKGLPTVRATEELRRYVIELKTEGCTRGTMRARTGLTQEQIREILDHVGKRGAL